MTQRLYPAAICLLAAALAVRVVNARTEGRAAPISSVAPQAAAQAGPPAQAAEYVGSDTCTTCHQDNEHSLNGTPHSEGANPRTPAATPGCESCHRPSNAHAHHDAQGHIKKLAKMNPRELSATSLA